MVRIMFSLMMRSSSPDTVVKFQPLAGLRVVPIVYGYNFC